MNYRIVKVSINEDTKQQLGLLPLSSFETEAQAFSKARDLYNVQLGILRSIGEILETRTLSDRFTLVHRTRGQQTRYRIEYRIVKA